VLKISPLPGFDPWTAQLLASRYPDPHYNSQFDLKEIGWKNVDLINLAQEKERLQAVANSERKFWFLNFGQFPE
jgi:hypothetical protein